jgi:transcriptional regulator with PAS, ATPase and Fis domain
MSGGPRTINAPASVLQDLPQVSALLEASSAERPLLLVGRSRALREIRSSIATAAPTSVPVLITGETGTGKEVVARTLHAMSPRAHGPFVAVNCAALPETLLESELFGHERGAFTGAWTQRPGYFELAHEGTILLDELAAMPMSLQPKLLRALEMGAVRRVGGNREIKIDVRVLGTMNTSPKVAVQTGRVREDLYYRLNVFSVALPPLQERLEDIPLLVETFIAEFNLKYAKRVRGADRDALDLLLAQAWPGNVRQLRNSVEWAVMVCEGDVVTPSCLPLVTPGPPELDDVAPPDGDGEWLSVPVGTRLRDCERELILRTVKWANQNKTRAAKTLRISAKTLHDKLRRYAATTALERRAPG